MLQFTYRARGRSVVAAIVVGGLFAAVGVAGIALHWGIRLRGLVDLGPHVAFWFYLLAVVGGLVLIATSAMTARAGHRDITIEPGRLTVPKNERSRVVVVLTPNDIRDLKIGRYNDVMSLAIKHTNGTTKLFSPHFDSPQAFSDCIDAVEAFRAGQLR